MKTLLALVVFVTAGCQTQFAGSAHITRAQCQAKCQSEQMQMAGMVYMGEYSSACLCEPQRASVEGAPGAAAAAAGSAVGVVVQMRREASRRRQEQRELDER
jgi:hypothetical protein